MMGGFVLSGSTDWVRLALLIWFNTAGVFMIYRFNDFVDQKFTFKNIKEELSAFNIHSVMIYAIILSLPLAFFVFSLFTFCVLIATGFLGLLYSFPLNKEWLRLKNIFFVKNAIIGFCWGSLILIGADGITNEFILPFFLFASVQVFIGSVLRDVPDRKKDLENKARTLPIVMGMFPAFLFIHSLNLFSVLFCYMADDWHALEKMIFPVILFRFVVIARSGNDPGSIFWNQTMNLMTCVFLFLMILFFQCPLLNF